MEKAINFGFRGRRRLFACLAMVLAVAGCGVKGGPPRFDLSGTVNFNGRPVPLGYISFAPDTAKGNSGPGAAADIRGGRYSTPTGQGTVGGPQVVTICGFDGVPYQTSDGPSGRPNGRPMGKPLFTAFVAKVDLPKQTAVHNFEVPK